MSEDEISKKTEELKEKCKILEDKMPSKFSWAHLIIIVILCVFILLIIRVYIISDTATEKSKVNGVIIEEVIKRIDILKKQVVGNTHNLDLFINCQRTIAEWGKLAKEIGISDPDIKEKFMSDYEKCLNLEAIK